MIFIVFVYIQVWCIPLHYHLQFFDQLIETGTRARFLFPAVTHQLISVMDKKKKAKKKTNQLKLVKVPIHYYMYRHRFSDLVEEVSFRPAGSHSRRIIRLVGFLPSLRASSPFGGSLQVHARATRERKNYSEGTPLARTRAVRFPRPNGELARRLILALSISLNNTIISLYETNI